MEKGGQKAAAKFLDALVKSVQSLCHGYLEFQNGIEIVGFINLSVDKENSVDCVLKEKVCKTAENATSFISNSYHAKPVPEEAPSGNCHQSGKQTVPSSISNSSPSNRLNSEARDSSQFSHPSIPSRSSVKRKAFEDHRGEPSPKKTSFHPSSHHRSSSENLHGGNLVSVDSSETEQAESAVGGSRSPDDMDQVKLTGSGIVLEPVDDQGCAGEESSDFDVTFIKEEFVEDENEFDSSANSQHLAGEQYRRGQNSTAPFCPISTSSLVDPANAFKVEPAEHHDSQGIPTFQPHPGSSGMAGEEWSKGNHQPSYYQRGRTSEGNCESLEMKPALSQAPDSSDGDGQETKEVPQAMVAAGLPSAPAMGTDSRGSLQSRILLCEYCDASFTSPAGLYLHRSSVHFKRKFVCSVCDKCFTRKETLTNHMFSHSMPNPHCSKCHLCSAYLKPSLLRHHIATKHADRMEPQ